MTQISNGIYEDASGNLVDINGKVLVEAEKRTKTEVYSRAVGYLRPVAQWNRGKQSEWKDRRAFVAPKIEVGEGREGSDA
jgi:hypothetical protein